MGHVIEHQITVGNCQLIQCVCGRSALKVRNEILLLSSCDVVEIGRIFESMGHKGDPGASDLAVKLRGLSGGKKWTNFTIRE